MNKITIRQLMTLAPVFMAVMVVIALIISLQRLQTIDSGMDQTVVMAAATNHIKDTRFHVVQIQQFLTDVSATGDRGGYDEADANRQNAHSQLDALGKLIPEIIGSVDDAKRKVDRLSETGRRMAEAYLNEGRDAGNQIMKAPGNGFDDASATLAEELDLLSGTIQEKNQESVDEVQDLIHSSTSVLLIAGGVVVVLLVGLMLLLYRLIIPPLVNLSETMTEMSSGSGDLSTHLKVNGECEIGSLATSFNTFVEKIHGLIKEVAQTSTKLSQAGSSMAEHSEQTMQGMKALEQNTEAVADSVSTMVSRVEEMASNAHQAEDAAQRADSDAVHGREVVEETIQSIMSLAGEVEQASQSISNLEEESNNIGGILEVIRAIADQTNLLALNAAIEAARAGEQGRGFAVVADEVRSLASRTGQATAEIQTMIGRLQNGAQEAVGVMQESRKRADSSVEQASEAREALAKITSAVAEILQMNREVAHSATQQAGDAESINRHIHEISSAADRTFEMAQLSEETSEMLGSLLADLNQQLGKFKFSKDGALDLSKAKSAHLAWKSRLRAFLDGKSSLTQKEAVSHHDCLFGKWYYSDGLDKFSHLPEMRDVEGPHAELHRLIKQIIEAKDRNDDAQAEQLYQKISPLSQQIVALLDKIELKAG